MPFLYNLINTKAMADNLNERGAPDSSLINTSEQWELDYWTRKFNCTEDELKKAVQEVGSSAQAVEQYLKN